MKQEMVECPRCGGWGGEPGSNFGDHGWHPCFACGETGKVTKEQEELMTQPEPLPLWYDDASYARYQSDW